jgi:hypothetical protein
MYRIILFFISASLLFSGCIEIEEKIVVNSDRSGRASYSVMTSEFGSLLYGFSGLFGFSVDDLVKDDAEALIRTLGEQPGIENISYNLTHSHGLYYLSFDFSDASSFNKAIYMVAGQKRTMFSPGYLKIRRSRFKRLNFSPYLAKYLTKEGKELDRVLKSNMLTFSSEITFPREIRRTGNKDIHLSPHQNTISQKYKLRDILENNADTGIRVRY